MQWLERQIREGMNARTYVLVGTLLAMLLWIYALDQKSRSIRAHAVQATASAASAAPAPAVAGAGSVRAWPVTVTPPGWGEDPFDRRAQWGKE